MIYVGIDVAKDKHDPLFLTLTGKYYTNLLLSLTTVRGLKPYFKELYLLQKI